MATRNMSYQQALQVLPNLLATRPACPFDPLSPNLAAMMEFPISFSNGDKVLFTSLSN